MAAGRLRTHARDRPARGRQLDLLHRADRLPMAATAQGLPALHHGAAVFLRGADSGVWQTINHVLLMRSRRTRGKSDRRRDRQPIGQDDRRWSARLCGREDDQGPQSGDTPYIRPACCGPNCIRRTAHVTARPALLESARGVRRRGCATCSPMPATGDKLRDALKDHGEWDDRDRQAVGRGPAGLRFAAPPLGGGAHPCLAEPQPPTGEGCRETIGSILPASS